MKLKPIYESILKEADDNDLSQYNEVAKTLFSKYLKDNNFDLVTGLKRLENKIKRDLGRGGNKSLWFRLHKGDTLATDIRDIERYISNKGRNYTDFLESIEDGLASNSIETKYS